MDFVQIMLIVGMAAGAAMMVISFIGPGDKRAESDMRAPRAYVLDRKLEDIDSTISEADNVITELGGISQNVIKEMDSRYNELLFLYNLIDEKEKGIHGDPISVDRPEGVVLEPRPYIPAAKPAEPLKRRDFNNPRLPEIMELKEKGMNVQQIAKELNMGQGEVSLILSLKEL